MKQKLKISIIGKMELVYLAIFIILVVLSGFFSSAETSFLSIDKIKLSHSAKKDNKKAKLIKRILNSPEEFFSTILIGNNLVNIAAASISTVVISQMFKLKEEMILLISTVFTTTIILIFSEILPKSYAFKHSEKLSNIYAYPIRFLNYLFYPIVKFTSFLTSLVLRKTGNERRNELGIDEIKHFLSSEIPYFRLNRENLRMINEIIDLADKDIKSIMTPRPNIIAIEESSTIKDYINLALEKSVTKIPLYKDNLDNITGIVHTKDILQIIFEKDFENRNLKNIAEKPLFVSEFAQIPKILKDFKKRKTKIAIVIDEYGTTIGLLTLNDIFKEIFGEIEFSDPMIKKEKTNTYIVRGGVSVEDLNEEINLNLPEKKDYSTLSGLFIYHYGKFPQKNSSIKIGNIKMIVLKMGKLKIDKIRIEIDEDNNSK